MGAPTLWFSFRCGPAGSISIVCPAGCVPDSMQQCMTKAKLYEVGTNDVCYVTWLLCSSLSWLISLPFRSSVCPCVLRCRHVWQCFPAAFPFPVVVCCYVLPSSVGVVWCHVLFCVSLYVVAWCCVVIVMCSCLMSVFFHVAIFQPGLSSAGMAHSATPWKRWSALTPPRSAPRTPMVRRSAGGSDGWVRHGGAEAQGANVAFRDPTLLCVDETCRCPAPFPCPDGDCGCRALLCVPSYTSVRDATCRGCLFVWTTLLWCEVVVSWKPLCVVVCWQKCYLRALERKEGKREQGKRNYREVVHKKNGKRSTKKCYAFKKGRKRKW